MDEYIDFGNLAARETEGTDFRVRVREVAGASTVVAAPHGGGIEPGTTEVAQAIAGDDCSFCAFEGLKTRGNGSLHITSTRFDEPRCIGLVQRSQRVVAVHGEKSKKPVVFIGGLDGPLLGRLSSALRARGFTVLRHPHPDFQGTHPANLCNRGQSGAGVQLELSFGLRRTFFKSLSTMGRKTTTDRFSAFVAAVRKSLNEEGAA